MPLQMLDAQTEQPQIIPLKGGSLTIETTEGQGTYKFTLRIDGLNQPINCGTIAENLLKYYTAKLSQTDEDVEIHSLDEYINYIKQFSAVDLATLFNYEVENLNKFTYNLPRIGLVIIKNVAYEPPLIYSSISFKGKTINFFYKNDGTSLSSQMKSLYDYIISQPIINDLEEYQFMSIVRRFLTENQFVVKE